MITGHSDFKKIQELPARGKIYKYLAKPVLPENLLKTIDEAISDIRPAQCMDGAGKS
jgi:DNA-binding NtrC family response regulator